MAAGLEARGIDLVVLAQGLDTTTPAGRLLFHMLGAVDEFTADLNSESTREGLAAARARGRVGGRPTVMTPANLAVARQLLDSGQHTVTDNPPELDRIQPGVGAIDSLSELTRRRMRGFPGR